MILALLGGGDRQSPPPNIAASKRSEGRRWWQYWEVYPILVIAVLLRFYHIETTEFDGDQVNIFRMAYDAVSHGHLVATSNIASLRIYNPPGIIYLLMVPAAFSSNPLGGALLTALLATLGVLLTYWLMARYYGRLAATIAALLYATAALPVFYSRFMWQQNVLLFLAPLYLLILFRGVVERQRGWFGPALFLLGLAIQLHGSGLFYAVPLVVALVLVPRTVGWRDLIVGSGLLLLSYAPYLVWEIVTDFKDVSILLQRTGGSVIVDTQVLSFYQLFLSPLNKPILTMSSRLVSFRSLFDVVEMMTTGLVLGGVLLACWRIFSIRSASSPDQPRRLACLRHWWRAVSVSPPHRALLVLLAWQLPLLILLRHSIKLYPHYLIGFMPGPYILAALFLAAAVGWFRGQDWRGVCGRVAVLGLAALVILAQMAGSWASVLDLTTGNFVDRQLSTVYYNDLASLQRALSEADQLARQHHLRHIYLGADQAWFEAGRYLSRQVATPVTVMNDACAILPNPATGPALLLVGPYSDLPEALFPPFAKINQIGTSPRLGGPPFRFYIMSPAAETLRVQETLGSELQWLGHRQLTLASDHSVLTYWRSLRTLPEREGTLYSYEQAVVVSSTKKAPYVQCHFTSLVAGDLLLMRFTLTQRTPTLGRIKMLAFQTTPFQIVLPFPVMPLTFDTFMVQSSPHRTLVSGTGDGIIDPSASKDLAVEDG